MNGIVSPVFHADISACVFFLGEVAGAKTKVKISFEFYIDDLFFTFWMILGKYVSKLVSIISSLYKDNTIRQKYVFKTNYFS